MAIAERVLERGVKITKDHVMGRLEPNVHIRGSQIAVLDAQLHGLNVLLNTNCIDKQTYRVQKTPLLEQRRRLSSQQIHDRIELRRAKRAKEAKKTPHRLSLLGAVLFVTMSYVWAHSSVG